MPLDHHVRQAAERLKQALEAEFAGVRVEIDPAVGDPDTEHAYLWLDGAGADPENYVEAWDYAHRLAQKLWQEDDLLFVIKKRNAPLGEVEPRRDEDFD